MFRGRKYLEVEVNFLKQRKRKPKSDEAARKWATIVKKNISHFYSPVYAGLFGGKAVGCFARDFHPDVVKKTKTGMEYTEVKCASGRSISYLCSTRQAANCCSKLLQRLDKGDVAPRMDYAFFRYGQRDDVGWTKLSNEVLESKLGDARFSVVAPLNLALFLFLTAPTEVKDQRSSESNIDYQRYFKIRGGLMRSLSEGLEPLEGLVANREVIYGGSSANADDFFLDDLRFERETSPMVIVNGQNIIQPFEVTRYSLSAKKYTQWLAHFQKNHERILGDMEVEDLYAKAEEVPF